MGDLTVKEELIMNPKIKFVLFERTLSKLSNRVSYLSVFDSLASFLRYFSFFDMQITHDVVRAMTYRRMLYIFAIIKRNHFKMYMFGVVGETRT